MITCLGIIVAPLETADRQELCDIVTKWLKNHQYALHKNLVFEIDGIPYITLNAYDKSPDDNELMCLYYLENYKGHIISFA